MVHPITHPFRADVTIICVDFIGINSMLYSIPIQIKFAMIIYWTWHLFIVVRNSLTKICFVLLFWYENNIFHPLHTPFALMLRSLCVDFICKNWMLYSIPILIKFAMIIYWTWHLCMVGKEFTGKNHSRK